MLKVCCNGVRGLSSLNLWLSLLYSTSSSSTAKSANSTVDYPVKALGISIEETTTASTKVSRIKSKKNADSVIDFLETGGLNKTQINRIINSVPRLINSNVEKTLKPKFRVFQDLGLSGSELVDLIASNPSSVTSGVNDILPSIDFLKSILGTDENVVSVIKRSGWLLSCKLLKRVQQNVALLQSHGLSNESIQNFIVKEPKCLLRSSKRLEESLVRIKKNFGIPQESPMFQYGVNVFSTFGENILESKYEIFKSYGWSEADIAKMVRKQPSALRLSEATIRRRLDFFMKELGYDAGYIASHPMILMFSMEKRVLPRNAVLRVLKERKLIKNPSLYMIVCFSESRFFNRYVLPYKDDLPQLYEAYINNKMDSFIEGADFLY